MNALSTQAQKTFDALSHTPLNLNDIVDIELEIGGGPHDYADSFINSATWNSTGKSLTQNELDQLNDEHSDFVYEEIMNQLY